MKKSILISLLVLPFIYSCSSEEETKPKMSGTYIYAESIEHDKTLPENKDNYAQLHETLTLCNTLEYTVGTPIVDEYNYKKNLCEKTEHDYCIDLSISFSGDKCIYNEKTYKVIQDVTRITETTKYTFTEGNFIFSYGGIYCSGMVYPYGIYITQPYASDYTMKLPLDGDFSYDLKYTSYTADTYEEEINNITETFDYTIDGDVIYLSNGNTSLKAVKTSNGIIVEKNGVSYILSNIKADL